MIPHIIHYCWVGGADKPELVQRCMASWHQYMPDWTYREWNEKTLAEALGVASFDEALNLLPIYVKEAYGAKKYAFVSDYVRLWALEREGGLYMDVDFEVYKSFAPLVDVSNATAFAGYEGSKRQPVMMGVIAAEAHSPWVLDMLRVYDGLHFLKPDGTPDMYPNTARLTDRMEQQGFVCDGIEKDWMPALGERQEVRGERREVPKAWIHVFPVDYFCPGLTTGENIRSERTYCEHKGLHSWGNHGGWKARLLALVGSKWKPRLIKMKRHIVG